MARVSIKDLSKVYGGGKAPLVQAVKNIDLDIQSGEFMVLVGPSGCGKSTTLRMIAGLEDPTEGSISIGDTVVNDVLPKDRDIAMVFQNYALYPHMTVFNNMAFSLKLRKFPKQEIKERVEQAAKKLGIEKLLQRKPKELSGGQRQRVAVGRSIVRQPKVFLFDEPLSNLDAKMRVSMRAEISKLHTSLDATMIYVTHDQTEAMTMGDRITVMKDGSIMQIAKPMELYNQPANLFVAGFIGSPSMNFFNGSISTKDSLSIFIEDNPTANALEIILPISLAEKAKSCAITKVTLGIRPEDIIIEKNHSARSLQAQLEVYEPMGAEAYLYLNTGENSFVARTDNASSFETNSSIHFSFIPEKLHLFDSETEQVI